MTRNFASHILFAGFAAAGIIGIAAEAFAQSEPLRITMQPGESLRQAMREAIVGKKVAELRANWAAAEAAGLVSPSTYASPKITSVKVLTPSVNVTAPLPAPKIQVTFQTGTPGLASISYEFSAPGGKQYIFDTYSYPGPAGLKNGTIDLQAVASNNFIEGGHGSMEALSKLFEPNGTVLSYTNWIFVMPLFCA